MIPVAVAICRGRAIPITHRPDHNQLRFPIQWLVGNRSEKNGINRN